MATNIQIALSNLLPKDGKLLGQSYMLGMKKMKLITHSKELKVKTSKE